MSDDQPGPDDLILCVALYEGRDLRTRFPGITVLSATGSAYRGLTLRGKVFVTPMALTEIGIERLMDHLAPCTVASGRDLVIQVLT